MAVPDRVVAFLDYQNVYRSARRTFHTHGTDPHWMGQVSPTALGQHLAADSRYDRALEEVRVYRGLPSSKRDAKGYAACRRQLSAWAAQPGVTVIARPLQYIDDDAGNLVRVGEKGIDVALAVDIVTMAASGALDVAIIFSLDTDLHPAMEFVAGKQRAWGKPRIETAAWTNPDLTNPRLSLRGQTVYCHWIDRITYTKVQDLTNYARPAP